MTLLELRDRCNELLSGTAMPSYDTGICSLGPASGEMRVAITGITAELHEANAEIDRLSLSAEYWQYRCNAVENMLADAKAEILSLQTS